MSRGTNLKRVASQGLSHLFLKTFAAVYSDTIDRPWVFEDTAGLAQSVQLFDCRAGGRGFDSRGRTRILKFKSELTFAFFAGVNHISGPLRKQKFTSMGSKGHGL